MKRAMETLQTQLTWIFNSHTLTVNDLKFKTIHIWMLIQMKYTDLFIYALYIVLTTTAVCTSIQSCNCILRIIDTFGMQHLITSNAFMLILEWIFWHCYEEIGSLQAITSFCYCKCGRNEVHFNRIQFIRFLWLARSFGENQRDVHSFKLYKKPISEDILIRKLLVYHLDYQPNSIIPIHWIYRVFHTYRHDTILNLVTTALNGAFVGKTMCKPHKEPHIMSLFLKLKPRQHKYRKKNPANCNMLHTFSTLFIVISPIK